MVLGALWFLSTSLSELGDVAVLVVTVEELGAMPLVATAFSAREGEPSEEDELLTLA